MKINDLAFILQLYYYLSINIFNLLVENQI